MSQSTDFDALFKWMATYIANKGEDEAVTEYIKNIIKTSHDIDEAMKRCSTGLDQMATHDAQTIVDDIRTTVRTGSYLPEKNRQQTVQKKTQKEDMVKQDEKEQQHHHHRGRRKHNDHLGDEEPDVRVTKQSKRHRDGVTSNHSSDLSKKPTQERERSLIRRQSRRGTPPSPSHSRDTQQHRETSRLSTEKSRRHIQSDHDFFREGRKESSSDDGRELPSHHQLDHNDYRDANKGSSNRRQRSTRDSHHDRCLGDEGKDTNDQSYRGSPRSQYYEEQKCLSHQENVYEESDSSDNEMNDRYDPRKRSRDVPNEEKHVNVPVPSKEEWGFPVANIVPNRSKGMMRYNGTRSHDFYLSGKANEEYNPERPYLDDSRTWPHRAPLINVSQHFSSQPPMHLPGEGSYFTMQHLQPAQTVGAPMLSKTYDSMVQPYPRNTPLCTLGLNPADLSPYLSLQVNTPADHRPFPGHLSLQPSQPPPPPYMHSNSVYTGYARGSEQGNYFYPVQRSHMTGHNTHRQHQYSENEFHNQGDERNAQLQQQHKQQQCRKTSQPLSHKWQNPSRVLGLVNVNKNQNTEESLREHFESFGEISAIYPQMSPDGSSSSGSAVVIFKTLESGVMAHDSSDAVFGNRFIKLFFVHDSVLKDQSSASETVTKSTQRVISRRAALSATSKAAKLKKIVELLSRSLQRQQHYLKQLRDDSLSAEEHNVVKQALKKELLHSNQMKEEKKRLQNNEEPTSSSTASIVTSTRARGRTTTRGRARSRARGRGRGGRGRYRPTGTVIQVHDVDRDFMNRLTPLFASIGALRSDPMLTSDNTMLITYKDRGDAVKALSSCTVFEGRQLEVSWYKLHQQQDYGEYDGDGEHDTEHVDKSKDEQDLEQKSAKGCTLSGDKENEYQLCDNFHDGARDTTSSTPSGDANVADETGDTCEN